MILSKEKVFCRLFKSFQVAKDPLLEERTFFVNSIICPANTCLFKVNINFRKVCKICSKLTIKTRERRHCSAVSIVGFEQVNVSLVVPAYETHSESDGNITCMAIFILLVFCA